MSKQLSLSASIAALSMALFAIASSFGGYDAAIGNPLAVGIPNLEMVAILR